MSVQRVDLILFPMVLLIGILFGSVQVASMSGVPAHGCYHPSDMNHLQDQLLGRSVRPNPGAAGADHPAWLAVCGVYQRMSAVTGLQGMRLWNITMPVLLGLNLCLFLGVARQLRFTRGQSIGLTAVFLATGATITWSVVIETHVLAPTGLLLAALILTNRRFSSRLWTRPTPASLAGYGLAVALAASITFTNIMLPILAVLPVNIFRHSHFSRLVARTARRLPTLVTAMLAGIGLLAFVNITGWYLIRDRDMQQFLELLVPGTGDATLILKGIPGSRWESILSLAWIAPPMDAYTKLPDKPLYVLERGWSTAPAYLTGLVVLLLTLCSLRVCSARTMLIPCFAIFGVAIHSLYGLGESFLFSANYTWASLLSAGLLGRKVLPRQLGLITFTLAAILLLVNLFIWYQGVQWILENNHLLPPA